MIIANKGKKYEVVYKSACVRELQDMLENLTWDYVLEREVIEKKYYKKSVSGKWGKVPLGFFVVAQFDKLTIYRKFIKYGIFYNSVCIEKAISFLLVAPEKRIFVGPEKNGRYIEFADEKNNDFAQIHSDIINRKSEDPIQRSD